MKTPMGELDGIVLDRAVVNINHLRAELDRQLSPYSLEKALNRLWYSLQTLTILHRLLTDELEISRHPDAER